jgi:predicted RNase H-like HicB family nuclease
LEYTVIIRKAPDGFHIASCPLVPEAHAQGKTHQECLANIKEVLELCLECHESETKQSPSLPLSLRVRV